MTNFGQLLSLADGSTEELRAFLRSHQLANPVFAEQLASFAHQADSASDLDTARRAQIVAAEVWDLTGNSQAAGIERANAANAMLMGAQTAEQYRAVRSFISQTLERFRNQAGDDIPLLSHLCAADCFFWESQLSEGRERTALAMAGARELALVPMRPLESPLTQQLASQIQALAMTLWRSIVQRSHDEVDSALSTLAELTEKCVDVAIEFHGDSKKTEHVRTVLATLCSMHGDSSHAYKRWSAALDGPGTTETYPAWLPSQYAFERSVASNKTDRYAHFEAAAVRGYIRDTLDSYRSTFKSIGGRHWAANVADQLTGEFLWRDIKASLLSTWRYFYAIEQASARVLLDELRGLYPPVPM